MTATPILALLEHEQSQALQEDVANEAYRWLEFFSAGGKVLDRGLVAQPGSPADGDAYLLTATPTGANWTGQGGKIALRISTAWAFKTAKEGMSLYVADEDVTIVYDGAAWATLGGSSLTAADVSATNTGTSTTTAVTPDALAGSRFGTAVISILVSDPAGSAITTGDGKAYWRVPSTLNGMDLVGVAAALTTVSSSGIPTVQIANVTQAADMLTTKLTIDASETDSSTAAAAAVIDTGNDDVATGDMLRIDIDVAGTGAKGLMVEMQFRLP